MDDGALEAMDGRARGYRDVFTPFPAAIRRWVRAEALIENVSIITGKWPL